MNIELLNDLCKFQYSNVFDEQNILSSAENKSNPSPYIELEIKTDKKNQQELMRSYLEFIIKNWDHLKFGELWKIKERPKKSFKHFRNNEEESKLFLNIMNNSTYKIDFPNENESSMEVKSQGKVIDTKQITKQQLALPPIIGYNNSNSNLQNSVINDRDHIKLDNTFYKLRNTHSKYLSHSLINELVHYGFSFNEYYYSNIFLLIVGNRVDEDGFNAIMEIILFGEAEVNYNNLMKFDIFKILEHIINFKVDLACRYQGNKNFKGFNLLHFAVMNKKPQIIHYLLSNRIFLNTALDINGENDVLLLKFCKLKIFSMVILQ